MKKKRYKRPSIFDKTIQETTGAGLMAAGAVLTAVGGVATKLAGGYYKTVPILAFKKGGE